MFIWCLEHLAKDGDGHWNAARTPPDRNASQIVVATTWVKGMGFLVAVL